MLKILQKIINVLTKQQKIKVLIIQLLNLIVSFFEIITLGTLAIFIGLLATTDNILENKYLNFFYNYFDFSNKFEFMFFFGVVVLLLYLFTGIINIVITWKTNVTACTLNQYLSNLVLKNYVYKNWQEYTKLKLSDINKDIFTDLNILSNSVVVPLFNLFNKLFIAFSLSLTLIVYNYKVAFFGMLIYSIVYFLLLIFVKKINSKITKNISINRKKNHAFIHNFFSGFKEVIIFNLRNSYFDKIKKNNNDMIYPTTFLLSLTQIPRFFVELISYIVVITGILLIIKTGENLDNLLPLVAVYAFAGLKLLPAFQQIYLAFVRIKAGQVAMNNLYPKLIRAKKGNFDSYYEKTDEKLNFKNNIKLNNVSFNYDTSTKKPSVKNLNLNIKKNSIVGLAGPSGGGKSTIIDIISGLLVPTKGNISIDGKILNQKDLRKWQNNFGIVTQMPFLSGDRIIDNISFGKIKGKIDYMRLNNLVKKVELKKFIRKQKKGLNSKISDRGINISGGERQRIAIARSLYFKNDIIVFDEATNALDKITENKIIDFIKKLSNFKTIIIITHRTNTLKICSDIHIVKDGLIVNSGTYNSLKKKSTLFKKLIADN